MKTMQSVSDSKYIQRLRACLLAAVMLQGVVDVERQLGGILVDCSKQILFQYNGGSLSLSVDHVSYGWRLKQTTACQVPQQQLVNTLLPTFVNHTLNKSPAVARVSRPYSWCTLATCVHNCTLPLTVSPHYPLNLKSHKQRILKSVVTVFHYSTEE